MSLPFKILGIDHLRFECGNAKLTAQYYCSVFGFSAYAFCNPPSLPPQSNVVSNNNSASNVVQLFHNAGCVDHVVVQNDVKLVFTATTNTKNVQFGRRIVERSDHVVDVALNVDNVAACFEYAVSNGAEVVFPPTEIHEEEYGTLIAARIKSPFDVYHHTILCRTNYNPNRFLPGYTTLPKSTSLTPAQEMKITHIDHLAICCYAGTMVNPINWYSRCLGFQRMVISDKEDATNGLEIRSKNSGLKLKTLITSDHVVNLTFVEPIEGSEPGQVRQFLDAHSGPGVQHIAFYTDDIIHTVTHLRARQVPLINVPSNYYEHMAQVPEMSHIQDDIEKLKELSILIDFEHIHHKNTTSDTVQYLLQLFTPPMCDRPTYFIELITRRGATGFGQGNITQLYKCMEELLRKKKEVMAAVAKTQMESQQTPLPHAQAQAVPLHADASEDMNEDFNVVFADELFSANHYKRWAELHNAQAKGLYVNIIEGKFESKTPEQITAIVQNANVIVASFYPLTASIIREAKKCKLIMAQGSGYNHVDVNTAKELGITVCNNPNWCNNEVAEHVIASVFTLGRDILASNQRMLSGQWARDKARPRTIKGSTIGVVGMGNIGQDVCKKASALGMRVIAFDPFVSETAKSHMLSSGAISVMTDTLEDLLRESDYVSLHAPLTKDTRHMINSNTLKMMKSSAFLINTARGEIIDTDALVHALSNRVIAGASLDVFDKEPIESDHPLTSLDNVILTPHTAGVSDKSFENGARLVTNAIDSIIQGDPRVQGFNLAATNRLVPGPASPKNNKKGRKTMRDIRDLCIQMKIPNLAAGMPEYAPPKALVAKMSDFANLNVQQRDDVDNTDAATAASASASLSTTHMYQERFGEPTYLNGVMKLHEHEYKLLVGQEVAANTQTSLTKNCFLSTVGVTGCMVSILHHLKETRAIGRKVRIALVEPFYTYHLMQARSVLSDEISLIDIIPSHINHDEGCTPDVTNIVKVIQGQAASAPLDLIIVSNPWNPAGRLWRKEELTTIIDAAAEVSCYIFIDEIYKESVFQEKLWWSPADAAASADDLKPNVIVARGFSKSMAVGGWRMGYAIAHPETIADLMKQHDRIYISGVAVHQRVVGNFLLEHLDAFKEHVHNINGDLQFNWRVISEAFERAFGWKGILPEGSIYGMIMHNMDSDDKAFTLALDSGVGVCPGNMFCRDEIVKSGFLRIHVATTREKATLIADSIMKFAASRTSNTSQSS